MKRFDRIDQTDALPNFGYIELQLLPDYSHCGKDIEETTKYAFSSFESFRNAAMRTMVTCFFDVLITCESHNVHTKFVFNINPQNSSAASVHMLRIQTDNGGMMMVDSFRNLPDEEVMAMISYALGMIEYEELE